MTKSVVITSLDISFVISSLDFEISPVVESMVIVKWVVRQVSLSLSLFITNTTGLIQCFLG